MDFLLRSGDDLVPVEVKAENARSKSLRTLIDSDRYKETVRHVQNFKIGA